MDAGAADLPRSMVIMGLTLLVNATLIALFYKLQNLFTIFAVKKRFREQVVRILQGNLYIPESLARARGP